MPPDRMNSFNPNAKISYKLPARSQVTLTVLDAFGRLIATLVDGIEERGEKSVNFSVTGLAGGEYSYQLSVREIGSNGKSKSYIQKRKLLLLQ
jgi:hypothetical protein